MLRRTLLATLAAGFAITNAGAQDVPEMKPPPIDPKNTVYLDLTSGRVVIRLRPDLAPLFVARVKHTVPRPFL